mgnify:FL=1
MQKKYPYLLFVFFIIFYCNIFSQTYLNLDWSDEKIEINNQFNLDPLIGIFSKHYIEYFKTKNSDEIYIYDTHHFRSKINSEINEINDEILIPNVNILEISDLKAKITNKDTVLFYNFSDLKLFEDKSGLDNNYKIFKLPGLQKEDIIEIMYTLKKRYNFSGNKNIQQSFPIILADFILIENDFKSNIKIYNSKYSIVNDTIIDSKKAKFVRFKYIDKTVNEQYSTPIANKIKISYQCYENDKKISQNEYWGNLVNNVSQLFFPSSLNKKANKIFEEIKSNYQKTPFNELSTANAIDKYVKNNFTISDEDDERLNNLNYILENKKSNDFSIIQVYTNLLKIAEIEYEVAISCNRFYFKFDPEFFDPNQLREFIIYLPKIDKYISPNRIEYRVSEPPEDLIGNYAMYIDKSLDYYFSEIVLTNNDYSKINKNINVSFSKKFKNATINESRSFTGYWGLLNRNYIYLSESEETEFLVDYFTLSGLENKKILKYKIINFDLDNNSTNEPLLISSKIQTTDLVKNETDSIILFPGKVIGLQSNLFEKEKRWNPIEINFPNEYDYNIKFDIPKGYTIANFENLNIYKKYVSVDGNITAKFKSYAKYDNNTLIIYVKEFYKSLRYEKNRYDEYRDVINAAAKFYESSVLLEKI